MLARHLLNGGGHRGAKQRRQAVIGHARRDRLDVLGEAHAQHLVSLVQHEHAHVRQVECALLDQVDDTARGAHDDLRAALKRADLGTVGGAAVHGDDVEAGGARSEILNGLGALHRELARGSQDQGLDVALIGVDDGQQRQTEGGRLAGTRLGDTHDVAQLKERRDRGGLDRGGDAEPHIGDGLEDLLGQSEAREGHGIAVFAVGFLPGVAILAVGLIDEIELVIHVHDVVALVAVHVVVRGHSNSLPVACGVAKPSGRAISAPQRGLTHNNKSRVPRGTITRGCASSLRPA